MPVISTEQQAAAGCQVTLVCGEVATTMPDVTDVFHRSVYDNIMML